MSNWNPTDQQLEDLKTGWTIDGRSAGELASLFGVTRNVIIGHIHRKGWAKAGGAGQNRPRSSVPRAAPVSKPLPPPTPKKIALVLEPSNFVAFDQLGPHHCRYPVDKVGGEFKGMYCGLTPNGTPYCEGHAAIVYQPHQAFKKPKGIR